MVYEGMKVILECGDVYDFHNIKSIEHDAKGITTIIGNYRSRGKYHTVKFFTESIKEWGA